MQSKAALVQLDSIWTAMEYASNSPLKLSPAQMDNTLTPTLAARPVAQLARHAKQPIIARLVLLVDSLPIPKVYVSLFVVMVIF